MARISNKDKALAYAANKGIILTMEDTDAGDELGAGAIEVWVCECCALWIENGDDYSCRDYYSHTHPDCDPAIAYLTDETFTIGYFHPNCNSCGTILRDGADVYGAIRLTN